MFSENNINWQELQPYLFIVFGLAVILYALFRKTKAEALNENGRKAEGIIFELKIKPGFNNSTSFGNIVPDKIIVRFVTDKLEWITAEAKNEFGVFYSGQYKIGDKVEVIYNPENPDEFVLVTKQSEQRVKLIIIVAGLMLIIAGAYKLLQSISN